MRQACRPLPGPALPAPAAAGAGPLVANAPRHPFPSTGPALSCPGPGYRSAEHSRVPATGSTGPCQPTRPDRKSRAPPPTNRGNAPIHATAEVPLAAPGLLARTTLPGSPPSDDLSPRQDRRHTPGGKNGACGMDHAEARRAAGTRQHFGYRPVAGIHSYLGDRQETRGNRDSFRNCRIAVPRGSCGTVLQFRHPRAS